jgi:hypothetical protein
MNSITVADIVINLAYKSGFIVPDLVLDLWSKRMARQVIRSYWNLARSIGVKTIDQFIVIDDGLGL